MIGYDAQVEKQLLRSMTINPPIAEMIAETVYAKNTYHSGDDIHQGMVLITWADGSDWKP